MTLARSWSAKAAVPSGGVYVLLLRLPRPRRLQVGRLGRRRFARGWYCYVGSAQRSLRARLRRHARRGKARRWHIDELTRVAEVVGAWFLEAPKLVECLWAGELARRGQVVSGFGASDCRCGGHLVCFAARREAADAVAAGCCGFAVGSGLGAVGPRWWPAKPTRAKNFAKKG